MTYSECAKRLREEGYNHVDGNRWGRIDGPGKIVFARVIKTDDSDKCKIVYGAKRGAAA